MRETSSSDVMLCSCIIVLWNVIYMLLGCDEISINEISCFLSLQRCHEIYLCVWFHAFEIVMRCPWEICCCLLHNFLMRFRNEIWWCVLQCHFRRRLCFEISCAHFSCKICLVDFHAFFCNRCEVSVWELCFFSPYEITRFIVLAVVRFCYELTRFWLQK